MNKKNAIAISLDYNYKEYLNILITSLIDVKCTTKIFVRLVDFTDEEIKEVKSLYDINFIIDKPNLSAKKTILKKTIDKDEIKSHNVQNLFDLKQFLCSPRSFYACHSRFLNIEELFKMGYKNVLTLDCDTFVLKNFDDIFIFDEDICVVQNIGDNKDNIFSNEGFLLFKKNKTNVNYINKINEYLFNDNNYLSWNVDYKALNKFLNSSSTIKILPEKYKDKLHRDNAIMWSGNNNNKNKIMKIYNEK
tara:strand:+ start:10575 stop:11318 length:744 start_codon:yes stop_codon:yes gene_type:complete